ncbi:MAG: hypothetical protein P1U32_04650 [Legionellaceae bacterium]|nr:hypothetical protein [Legionellaceae bacterium]
MTHVWLVGDGGIGNAIHEALTQKTYTVTVLSRKRGVDLFSHQNLKDVLASQNEPPSLVINTCGILHDDSHMPEKSIEQLEYSWLQKSIEANVLISVNLIQVLNQYVSHNQSIQFCAFSARVSSISDNHKGGWYSYRMSKAMLNMLVKTVALEWRIKSPASLVFAYHPGTVDTKLSKPFKQYIGPKQSFSPQQAAQYFLNVLFDDAIDKHGKLIDWQGLEILP